MIDHPLTREGVLVATKGMPDAERFQYALAALDARNQHLATEPDPLLGRFLRGSFSQKMWDKLWSNRGFIVELDELWSVFPEDRGEHELPGIYAGKIRQKLSGTDWKISNIWGRGYIVERRHGV